MSFLSILWTVGAFVLALGVLISIHELGHYLAARACGVKILRFSVGFGRPLWSRKSGRDETEWVLAAFPLGGYVKMLDEREGEVAARDLPRAFNRQSLWKRALIVLAGPLANLALAVLIYAVLFMTGVQEPRPLLAAPPADTLAAELKLGAGETARRVAGVEVSTWSELRWEILRRVVDHEVFELETIDARGHIGVYRMDPSRLAADALDGDVMRALGIQLRRLELPAVIGAVQAGSPAERAGVRADDRITALDETAIASWQQLALAIQAAGERSIELWIERNGQSLRIALTPEVTQERGRAVARIGIIARDDPELRQSYLTVVSYPMPRAFARAFAQTWDTSILSLKMTWRMLSGELSIRNLSGPVTIADYAGQSARLGGEHFLRFLALISISLGVLNLLPIPVLDGGHLMYYFAELIKGSPLSERFMEIGQRIGLTLLALLMILALYNDLNRLISG